MLSLLAWVAILACPDAHTPAHPASAAPPVGAAKILATLECTVAVRAREVTCGEPEPGSAPGAIPGLNHVRLVFSNPVTDTVNEVFSFEATAQNLLLEAVGTSDGTTVTGVKVFFSAGPTVTAYRVSGDTSKVTVRNPDGVGNFTAARQPYHFYNQILQPQEVSSTKRWAFNSPRTVAQFTFHLGIFAALPSEIPVPPVAPDTVPSWVYAPSNWLEDIPCGGKAVGNVLIVGFVPTASQEERQAAVDFIQGTVVGGAYGGPDGDYYIKVADDPTGSRLCTALLTLPSLPQVEFVSPIQPGPLPVYRTLLDGSAFQAPRNSRESPPKDNRGDRVENTAPPR